MKIWLVLLMKYNPNPDGILVERRAEKDACKDKCVIQASRCFDSGNMKPRKLCMNLLQEIMIAVNYIAHGRCGHEICLEPHAAESNQENRNPDPASGR
jgi:hypothetical protein